MSERSRWEAGSVCIVSKASALAWDSSWLEQDWTAWFGLLRLPSHVRDATLMYWTNRSGSLWVVGRAGGTLLLGVTASPVLSGLRSSVLGGILLWLQGALSWSSLLSSQLRGQVNNLSNFTLGQLVFGDTILCTKHTVIVPYILKNKRPT